MDAAQVLAYLHAQRDRIVKAISALEEMGWTAAGKLTGSTATKSAAPAAVKLTTRVVSLESRKKMAEAQQKRWAKKKRAAKYAAKKAAVAPVVTVAAVKEASVATTAAQGARKPMSAATKKKSAEAAKARLAAKKP